MTWKTTCVIEDNHIDGDNDHDDDDDDYDDTEDEDFEKDNLTVLTNNPCDWGHVAGEKRQVFKSQKGRFCVSDKEESLRGAWNSFFLINLYQQKTRIKNVTIRTQSKGGGEGSKV